DFFNKVKISNPPDGAVVASPVRIQATTANSSPVYAMQIYVDDVLKYHVAGSKLDTSLALSSGRHHVVVQSWDTAGGIHRTGVNAALPMPLGPHYMVVQAWDTAGGIYKKGISINVLPVVVTVSSPAPNSTVASPVHVHASVPSASTVFTIQVYVDDGLQYQQ